jgi:beta-galactosidase/beta-glucuronidase
MKNENSLLNRNWKTAWGDFIGAEYCGFNDEVWKTVDIPHNWDNYHGYHKVSHGNLHGTAWYRKEVLFDPKDREKRTFLEFEGVGSYARVWINGVFLGEHKGGRTCFYHDITQFIRWDNVNIIAVRADHPVKIADLPWVCGGCWGTPNTEGSQPVGIFRPVRITITGEVRVEPFGTCIWLPQISEERAVTRVKTEIKNYGASRHRIILRNEILDREQNILSVLETPYNIAAGEKAVIDQTFKKIENPRLWSLEDPYLHKLRTYIIEDTILLDNVDTSFGMRWIKWSRADVADEAEIVSDTGREVSEAKLDERPETINNYFIKRIGGVENSNIFIEPCGVEIYAVAFDRDHAVIKIKTIIRSNDIKEKSILLESFLQNYDETKSIGMLTSSLTIKPGEIQTIEQESDSIHFPDLWTRENPYLHLVKSTIKASKDATRVLEMTSTSFGIFNSSGLLNKGNAFMEITDKGKQISNFLLNGKPVFINGTCEYEHLLGNDHAFTYEQIEARIHQIKAAGFNSLREAHHPHNLH